LAFIWGIYGALSKQLTGTIRRITKKFTMKPRIILVLGFWISFCFCLQAQTPIARYAQSQMVLGHHDIALKEFLRAHFLGEKSLEIAINKNISDLFILNGDYKKALQFLDYYYFENKNNPAIQAEITLDKVKIYLLQKDTKSALFEVFQINSRNYTDKDRLLFFTGLALLHDHQYTEGLKYWKRLSYIQPVEHLEMDKLIAKLEKNEKRNPNRARWLSAVIPGLGQMIHGDVKDGLISLSVVAGLTYLFFDVANSLSYGDAFVSVAPWWARYELGGMSNAVKQAKKRKEERHLQHISEMVMIIQKSM